MAVGEALDEIHEINVTPFIDVILVLLIIFMVAAPLSTVDVNVDLPASTANPAAASRQTAVLTVKPDLTLALGESPIARGDLAGALDAETQGDKEQRVFVRADRAVPNGEVMEVMRRSDSSAWKRPPRRQRVSPPTGLRRRNPRRPSQRK